MATKVTLIDITSGFKGTDIQSNFTSIEDEFDKVLYRDGTSPNQMEASLDMNSNSIKNLKRAINNSDAATLKDVLDQTTEDATSKPATAITIEDSEGRFTSNNVEGALQEIGSIQTTLTLDNDFSTASDQKVHVERIADRVTITSMGTLDLDSAASVNTYFGTSPGLIPSTYRPTYTVHNVYGGDQTIVYEVRVGSGRDLSVKFVQTDAAGVPALTGDTQVPFTITYLITPLA